MIYLNERLLTDLLLFGVSKYRFSVNSNTLKTAISYILSAKRFKGNLM